MAVSGLLVRLNGKLLFIAASVVRFIRYDVFVTPFPGTALGMALLTGRIVPVIELGPAGKSLVVCEVDGEAIAFSGLEPIRSGFFNGSEREPVEAGTVIPIFPVRDYIDQVRRRRPGTKALAEEDSWMS